MAADPLVCIVILNYRNYHDTIECVRSVERIAYPHYRIVIVDNASDNESEAVLRETFPRHQVLQAGRNLGYAGGNNIGIRMGLENDAEFILILNNDAIVETQSLSAMMSFALDNPDAGLLGPALVYPDGGFNPISARRRPRLKEIFWDWGVGRWFQGKKPWFKKCCYTEEGLLDSPLEIDVVSGSCMLMRASLIDEIGLLDENTFLYWEEFIVHEKMRHSSYRTFLVPASRVVHKEGKSVSSIGTRAAMAELHSLNYYLRRYRRVNAVVRAAIMLSATMYFLPGILKTISGMRTLQRHLKSKTLV